MKSILDLPILSAANRARLLEMKGRVDLLIWASRKMPTPQDTDVHTYPIRLGWPEVFERSYNHPTDDGHLAKFVRTLAYAQELCVPYEGEAKQRGLKVTGDMWLKIGNMGKTYLHLSPCYQVIVDIYISCRYGGKEIRGHMGARSGLRRAVGQV